MSTKVRPAKDHPDALNRLYDRLREAIDETTSPRDLASLSKELLDVLDRIEALPTGEEESASARIEQRRAARRQAEAAAPHRPEGQDQ